MFEELKGGPFEHTKTCFRNYIFFFNIKKIALDTNSRFSSEKYAHNKKERNFSPEGIQIVAFQQSFSQCWWKRPILEGSLIQKATSTMKGPGI